jgi:hypothetical protein
MVLTNRCRILTSRGSGPPPPAAEVLDEESPPTERRSVMHRASGFRSADGGTQFASGGPRAWVDHGRHRVNNRPSALQEAHRPIGSPRERRAWGLGLGGSQNKPLEKLPQ